MTFLPASTTYAYGTLVMSGLPWPNTLSVAQLSLLTACPRLKVVSNLDRPCLLLFPRIPSSPGKGYHDPSSPGKGSYDLL